METDYLSHIHGVIESLGLSLACEIIVVSSRQRVVGKLKSVRENYAIKLVIRDSDAEAFRTASEGVVREAQVLRDLSTNAQDIYVADGQDEFRAWLITKWLEGDSSTNVCKTFRDQSDRTAMKRSFVRLFLQIVQKVSDLHQLGYVHGDIQPAHFLVKTSGEVGLIDFELTRRITELDFPYSGGLVHYNSPEVARRMLAHDANIPYDVISEIYALGSVLYFLYTGKTSTFYGSYDYKAIPMREKLMRIAEGRISTFAEVNASAFPALEEVLRSCLECDRAKRCHDLEQAVTRLKSIRSVE